MNIQSTQKIVEEVLNEKPETRESDGALIVEVLRSINPEIVKEPFYKVVPMCSETGEYPPFETIRRTRQKIQERNPHLRASKEVESYRAYKEHKFFDFAISRKG